MIYELSNYARGQMQFNLGKTGRMDQIVLRRVLIRERPREVFVLPRKRRIGKLGPAKVLEFPAVI